MFVYKKEYFRTSSVCLHFTCSCQTIAEVSFKMLKCFRRLIHFVSFRFKMTFIYIYMTYMNDKLHIMKWNSNGLIAVKAHECYRYTRHHANVNKVYSCLLLIRIFSIYVQYWPQSINIKVFDFSTFENFKNLHFLWKQYNVTEKITTSWISNATENTFLFIVRIKTVFAQ